MSIVIDVSADLESELAAEAGRLGLSVSEYVLRLIAAGRAANTKVGSGAELLSYWQREGLVGTRSDIVDSQAHARALRQDAENRPRA